MASYFDDWLTSHYASTPEPMMQLSAQGAPSMYQFEGLGPEHIPSPEQYIQAQAAGEALRNPSFGPDGMFPMQPGAPEMKRLAHMQNYPWQYGMGERPAGPGAPPPQMPGADEAALMAQAGAMRSPPVGPDGAFPLDIDPQDYAKIRDMTAQAYAPPGLGGSIPQSPGGPLPTLANLDEELAAGTMAGPYIPGARMSDPTAAPLPGPGPMGESMASAGAEGQELQRMLDNAMTPGGVFGVPTMPRMGADAGMAQSATPGKAPARRRPASKMQKQVMAMFGGDMGAYNQWHASLSDANRKKVTNWSKAFKHLNENPRSAPGAAPALNLPFNMMENLEAAPEPGAVEAPVGSVSSVGEGAVVPRAGSGVPAPAQGAGGYQRPGTFEPWVVDVAQQMAPGIFGYPEGYVSPGGPAPEAPGMVASTGPAGVAGPAFDMAANLEPAPAPYDPRSPEEQLLNPMPPGVNYRYNMARNLLPEQTGAADPQYDPRSTVQQQLDPMPPGVDYSYNMASPRHLMGGDIATTPYAPGPPDIARDPLQAPPMDLSEYAQSVEDPSMAQQMAHRKRVRQGAARARTGRRAQDVQAQSEYIAQLMRQDKQAEAKRRQEEELMGLAQRLQDTGTLHAPGPSAGRYTAGYQPLPQLPSSVDMGRDPMRLPAMDLGEYRRQVMMEMLLNQSGRPIAYDPALLDTLGQ